MNYLETLRLNFLTASAAALRMTRRPWEAAIHLREDCATELSAQHATCVRSSVERFGGFRVVNQSSPALRAPLALIASLPARIHN
jgi:Ni,Fe-hydrogenase III large subunit